MGSILEVWSFLDYGMMVILLSNGKEFVTNVTKDIGEGVKEWIKVGISSLNNNDLITCTAGHPFYVLNASSDRDTIIFEGYQEKNQQLSGSWIASKDLKIGDELLLSNGEHAIISSVEVEYLDVPQTTYNFEVEVSLPLLTPHKKDNITAKEDNSYNVEGKGLVNAKDIQFGDKIILESGEIATVLSAESKTVGGPQVTYNFEVADFHTYYVGTSGILVHNCCDGLDDAAFAQKTYSETFSKEGRALYSQMAGSKINTIDDLAGAFRNGTVNPSQVQLDYIVRGGNKLILNTRSGQALIRAGIPRSAWVGINRTGQAFYEGLLTGQLARNGLTSAGWMFPISTG